MQPWKQFYGAWSREEFTRLRLSCATSSERKFAPLTARYQELFNCHSDIRSDIRFCQILCQSINTFHQSFVFSKTFQKAKSLLGQIFVYPTTSPFSMWNVNPLRTWSESFPSITNSMNALFNFHLLPSKKKIEIVIYPTLKVTNTENNTSVSAGHCLLCLQETDRTQNSTWLLFHSNESHGISTFNQPITSLISVLGLGIPFLRRPIRIRSHKNARNSLLASVNQPDCDRDGRSSTDIADTFLCIKCTLQGMAILMNE